MSDDYEIEITGTVGPLIHAGLPEFHTVIETDWTVLTGTVRDPEELHRVLDLLDTHGTPALDIRISSNDTPGRDTVNAGPG